MGGAGRRLGIRRPAPRSTSPPFCPAYLGAGVGGCASGKKEGRRRFLACQRVKITMGLVCYTHTPFIAQEGLLSRLLFSRGVAGNSPPEGRLLWRGRGAGLVAAVLDAPPFLLFHRGRRAPNSFQANTTAGRMRPHFLGASSPTHRPFPVCTAEPGRARSWSRLAKRKVS